MLFSANSAFDSLWDVLLYMLWFFLFFAWLVMFFQVFSDIISRDMSGWSKAIWVIVIFFIPLLGTLIYLIVNGGGMERRQIKAAEANDAAMQAYIRETAGTGGPADQLKALKAMRDANEINDAEYEKAKAKVLS